MPVKLLISLKIKYAPIIKARPKIAEDMAFLDPSAALGSPPEVMYLNEATISIIKRTMPVNVTTTLKMLANTASRHFKVGAPFIISHPGWLTPGVVVTGGTAVVQGCGPILN